MPEGVPLADDEVAAIERATLQAVSPERVEALPGWLLPIDHGTVGRAKSAVPLSHAAPDLAAIDEILNRYRAAGLPPVLRLPVLPSFEAFTAELQRLGARRNAPMLTQVGSVDGLLALPGEAGEVADAPSGAWMAMYLGPGLDPVDGRHRARALASAAGTAFVGVEEGGAMRACGAASLTHGWLGVHGMRTELAWRGHGLAGRVLKAMGLAARRQGITRVFLQVDAANAPALALYRRAGLQTAWAYAYWRF